MPELRIHNFSISIDGYGAGPNQRLERPFGDGPPLHDWMFATRTGQAMLGNDGGDEELDDYYVAQGISGIGATIMGRNMFGPVRGRWSDDDWRGWWGPNPPFHHPVFVLTHHSRPSIEMEGGTTFHFVTDGIHSALEQAFDAAGGQDVRVGGGVRTVQQYLAADLVDHMHIVIVPVFFGAGERLFDSAALVERYECVDLVGGTAAVAHLRVVRRGE